MSISYATTKIQTQLNGRLPLLLALAQATILSEMAHASSANGLRVSLDQSDFSRQ